MIEINNKQFISINNYFINLYYIMTKEYILLKIKSINKYYSLKLNNIKNGRLWIN